VDDPCQHILSNEKGYSVPSDYVATCL